MEFFAKADCPLTPETLQQRLTGPELAAWCDAIDKVLWWDGEQGEIYCLWGQFRVQREPIRDGLRFTLPGCPNALAWTLTCDPADSPSPGVLVHCTINRSEHEPDFIESIELFVEDWRAGIERQCAAD